MDKALEKHIWNKNTWLRGLYILLFTVIYTITRLVIGAVTVVQFLFVLFTGSANARLLNFGQRLGTYVYQIILYLTFNSDDRPYPFGAWPSGPPPGRQKRSAKSTTSPAQMQTDPETQTD